LCEKQLNSESKILTLKNISKINFSLTTNLKLFRYFIIFFVFLSCLGFFITKTINVLAFNEIQEETIANNNAYLTIDEKKCYLSKYNLIRQINNIERENDVKIELSFYEHASNLYCHGRPVLISSDLNKKNIGEIGTLAIGIGVNTDVDNFERVGKFLLVFSILGFIFSKFKVTTVGFKLFNTLDFLLAGILFICYSLVVHDSITNSLSNFLIFIFLGNILFFFICQFFYEDVVLKTILSLSIIPMMFKDSNISFFWLALIYCLHLKRKNNLHIPRLLKIFFISISVPVIINLNSYEYIKPKYYFDWVLFRAGRHQGGIADINNGLQSIAYIFDISLLVLIFFILINSYKKTEMFIEEVFDSIIYGFIIWLFLYILSITSGLANYLIVKSFGLNESIDNILTFHPDGVNWRGITSSHELTGFWLGLVCSIIFYRFLETKNFIYLFYFIFSLISLSLNSQRTGLLIFLLLSLYIIFMKINVKLNLIIYLLIILILILTIFPYGPDRLLERLSSIKYTSELNIVEYHKSEISNTYKRYNDFNLEFPVPKNNFNDFTNFQNFYKYNLNTENDLLVNSIVFISGVFGRDVQWARFIHFNDLVDSNLLFGKGAGQSYQFLDILIQKPHSLYLTIFYQMGIFGILGVLFLLILILKKFANTMGFIYLIGIMFFINGIKNEFIFTHNQIVFTILMFCIFFKKINKEN